VLVVTGEAGLDRVVPTQLTAEYTRVWPHATAVTFKRTGHLGLVTRPAEFAGIITRFAEEAGLKTGSHVRVSERRVG
jgi:pimeloyl-ACP methyl ester carboxylesterase